MTIIDSQNNILKKYNISDYEFSRLVELRGCPVKLFDEESFDIKYKDYFSQELQSSTPLVSIIMTTYMHEKYISTAIEGIVNQKCDFKFELIIIEDCSSDATLDICMSYLKKYPDVIRLITPPKNTRCTLAHYIKIKELRGKYTAFCEGDDYWTDNKKLQKQISFLENNHEIGLCSSNYTILEEKTKTFQEKIVQKNSKINNIYDEVFLKDQYPQFQTAGIVIRTDPYINALNNNFIFQCKLQCGDIQTQLNAVFPTGYYYNLQDNTYTYRWHKNSSSYGKENYQLVLDGFLIRYWFMMKKYQNNIEDDIFLKYYFLGLRQRLAIHCNNNNEMFDQICQNVFDGIKRISNDINHYQFSLITLQRIAFELSLIDITNSHWSDNKQLVYLVRLIAYRMINKMQRHKVPLFTSEHNKIAFLLSKLLPWNLIINCYRIAKRIRIMLS